MKRIDFLGAPGVGKTTLYKELIRQRKKPYSFLTPEEAIVEDAKDYLRENRDIGRRFLKLFALNSKMFKKKHYSLASDVLNKYNKVTCWREDDDKSLNTFIKGIYESDFPANIKLLRYQWTLKTANKVGLIEQFFKKDTFVLFEESLTHRMIPAGPWDSSEKRDDLCKIVKLLKNIDSIIYLYANRDVVVERLKSRKGDQLNSAHKNMSDGEIIKETEDRLRAAEQLAEEMGKRGFNIVKINAEMSVEDQIEAASSIF